MRTSRRAAPIVLWLAALVGLLVVAGAAGHGALAAPPWRDPGAWSGWLAARTAPAATMALLRLVVLALTWYLLGATVVGVVLRVGRAGRLVSVADAVTVPFVRSLVSAGLGVGVVVASFGSPAVTVDAVPVSSSQVLLRPLPEAGEPPVLRQLDPAPAPAPTPTHTWTVAAGQHLWSISSQVLASAWGRAPSDDELVPYWRQVVEANRSRLADPANPDLLFPGQTLVVPPVP